MLWVTMQDGEIRQYNDASIYNIKKKWIKIASRSPIDNHIIAQLREDDVATLEFRRPCEVTFTQNVVETALNLVLKRARKMHGAECDKLAALKRLLADFNPQRKVWMR